MGTCACTPTGGRCLSVRSYCAEQLAGRREGAGKRTPFEPDVKATNHPHLAV